MIIRSKAPLRIGIAGGGTDLMSYSETYGGAVFNATISMYAYCTIIPTDTNVIKFIAYDNNAELEIPSKPVLNMDDGKLILHKGIYNRIVKDFNNGKPLSFIMSTSNDAPIGSGLGTSSTMVVAILEAYNRWLNLGLNEYEKAKLAYDIERNDCKLSGGKQDQYAAVFGGFNFMEFNPNENVVVNKLRFNKEIIDELECSLLLYYGGRSRSSSQIIDEQIKNTKEKNEKTMDAMHKLKENAYLMKDCAIKGDFKGMAELLNKTWEEKKKTSSVISNQELEQTINYVMANGGEAVKISGAGGGGVLMIYCNPFYRQKLIDALKQLKGVTYPVHFSKNGAESWIIKE